uniref:Heterokaryon incompatibility domain-containing protein n=1 Tax=Bionectria ochroleuca TaxID=29856 RepID=A0A8H7N2G5_BIOOC
MLPQDYQDIISICRAMSVQFLWIDSLCILQDSPEDLLREIKTMLNVYQNALLTLSICWDYSDSTLFPSRMGDTLSIIPPNDEYKNIAYSTAGCAFVNHVDEFKINVTHSLVNSRGWVLQERTLSRRTVYLGNEQLYWECDGAIASETVSKILQDKDVRRMPLFHDSDDFRNALWPKLVEKYSQCGLTSESRQACCYLRHFSDDVCRQPKGSLYCRDLVRVLAL